MRRSGTFTMVLLGSSALPGPHSNQNQRSDSCLHPALVGLGRMLQLRVYGHPKAMERLADALDSLPGARHVDLVDSDRADRALVTADLRADAADRALFVLSDLGVPADDAALVRLDRIGH